MPPAPAWVTVTHTSDTHQGLLPQLTDFSFGMFTMMRPSMTLDEAGETEIDSCWLSQRALYKRKESWHHGLPCLESSCAGHQAGALSD